MSGVRGRDEESHFERGDAVVLIDALDGTFAFLGGARDGVSRFESLLRAADGDVTASGGFSGEAGASPSTAGDAASAVAESSVAVFGFRSTPIDGLGTDDCDLCVVDWGVRMVVWSLRVGTSALTETSMTVMVVFSSLRNADGQSHGRVLEREEADGDVRVGAMTLTNAIATLTNVFFVAKVTSLTVEVASSAPSTAITSIAVDERDLAVVAR